MKKSIFIFLTLLSLTITAQDWQLKISSNVYLRKWKLTTKPDKQEETIGGAVITLYKAGGIKVGQTTSEGDGSFTVMVPANGEFYIIVSYPGCNSKRMSVSTKNVPEKYIDANFKPAFKITGGFIMVKPYPKINYNELNQDLIRVEFSEDKKAFKDTEGGTEQGLNIVGKIYDAEDELFKKFCGLNKSGDAALAVPDCPLAKKLYNEALTLIPGEEYPTTQLSKVGDCEKAAQDAAAKAKADAEAKAKADADAKAKEEADKLAKEQAKKQEAEAKAKADADAKAKEEADKLAKEQAKKQEAEAKAKADADAKAKEEADKLAKEQAKKQEAEAKAKADAEAKAKEEADKLAKEQAKKDKEKAKQEHLQKEKEALEKIKQEEIAEDKAKLKKQQEQEEENRKKKEEEKIAKEKAKKEHQQKEKEALERIKQEELAEDKAKLKKQQEEDEARRLKYETEQKEKNAEPKQGDNKYSIPQVLGGNKFKEYVTKGDDDFKFKRYTEAKKNYEEALKLKPNDPNVTKKLNDCNTKLQTK